MFVNPIMAKNISFGQIREEYKKNTDVQIRESIRDHLESPYDASYKYSQQIGQMSVAEIKARINKHLDTKITNQHKTSTPEIEPELKVDFDSLKKAKISSLRERIPNKVYTGQCLEESPEKVKALKDSGIKSALCFVCSPDYEESAKNEGINYTELRKIGTGSLNVFNFDAIDEIIKNPESYANNASNNINDLKEFINIVNGENKEFPQPLYMGCQWGTDRTFEWFSLYDILKDQPQDEPVSQEKIDQLIELMQIIESDKRW